MLINENDCINLLNNYNINITGILHIGAHDCEEKKFYNNIGVNDDNIIWIDALESKVNQCKNKGINNIYNYVITDKDYNDIVFNVSNNYASSSILDMETHLIKYPHINYIDKIHMKSITIDTFIQKHNINSSILNFWNFDIQGAELLALKGSNNNLKYADVLYLEVNKDYLYKNCALVNEIDDYLINYNFNRVETVWCDNGWGDAIYVKSKL
jgi:FkbM family methyltransferase